MEWDAIHLSTECRIEFYVWSLPFRNFIAWLLARKEFTVSRWLQGIIQLPLVLPRWLSVIYY